VKIPFLLEIEGAKLEAGEKVLRSRKTVLKAVSQAALAAVPLNVSLTAIRHCINTVNPRPREREWSEGLLQEIVLADFCSTVIGRFLLKDDKIGWLFLEL
jgi:hypothetical protein